MTVKWRLSDPGGVLSDYQWEVNPNADAMLPVFAKNIIYSVQLGPDVLPLIFEGRDQQLQTTASGTFVTQDQYMNLVKWYQLGRPFLLSDDLGNQFSIYILRYQPSRKRVYNFPWRVDYQLSWLVLSATYAS